MMQMRNGGSGDEDKEHPRDCDPSGIPLCRVEHGSRGAVQVHGEDAERVAFSEFRGYEAWQDVAVSQTDEGIKAILGNAVMINTYREGSLLPLQYAYDEKRLHLHGLPSKASGYEGNASTCF